LNLHSRSLLGRWFGDVGVPAFRSHYLGQQPLAAAGAALRGVESHLGWPELDAALALPNLDVVMVSRGQPVDCPRPRDLAELREYFSRGVGLTVRGAERVCPIPRLVGDRLGHELGPARVHLFATPMNTHGFGWHYDDEHVFIVQTAGVKDYYFRENTVAAHRPASEAAFASYSRETSRLWSARLIAGDVLYLPARSWHMARCVEADSLSLSVGVTLRDCKVDLTREAHEMAFA
jgi:hypothetical protein